MKRGFVWLITFALLAALAVPDALAKRSRGSRKPSAASSKRSARGKSVRGREARSRSSRGREARGRASRGRGSRRGERVARHGKLSRRERRALARSERGSVRLVRERVVVRGRHGRRVVRYRYVRRRSEPESAPVAAAPRPTGSGIPGERVTEIQNALIKAGYLDGPASGQYDDATVQAMKEFQSANGFSATGAPSAPALKKLGVAKRSNDGYAMPVNSVSENERRQRPPQSPE